MWTVAATLVFLGAGPPSPFTDEAVPRGVAYVTDHPPVYGSGIAFADLDDDGDADLVVVGRVDGLVGVFENDGAGMFANRSAASGIPPITAATGVVAGDYDLDGDLDLFITQGSDIVDGPPMSTPNFLLRNEGGFQFADVTAVAGLGHDDPSFGCGWGDYDGNGTLDLYVSNRYTPNRLYHNLGGTFVDIAVPLGVDRGDDPTFQSSFFDYDDDGDPDLYVANDKGDCVLFRNHFFENVGGAFVEVTDESNTEGCVWSMCIAIGDFNGNGHQDMYVTNLPPGNALMINQGDGTFTREELQANVACFETGWGSVFFDYDNDGHLDLYVCNELAPNRLYRHTGQWPCQDLAAVMGVADPGRSYVVAAADIDGDGDVDLAMQTTDENIRLYVNHEGQAGRWARFDVRGRGPARHAIGADVRVRTGTAWQRREVIAGCNYLGQNELVQHFGLAAAAAIDEVVVRWPDGEQRTLCNLAVNERWTLYPPDKLGDADHDGDRDLADFTAFAGCHGAPVQPGCEMMDFDGSGTVDAGDFASFLAVYDGPLEDCDGSGVVDLEQILLDPSLDANGNGVLDACECPADLDGSGAVDTVDFLQLLADWGPC